MTLESIDNVEGGDGLTLGVFGIGNGITDDGLEERLEDTTGLFVDHCRRVMLESDGARRRSMVLHLLTEDETYWQKYA